MSYMAACNTSLQFACVCHHNTLQLNVHYTFAFINFMSWAHPATAAVPNSHSCTLCPLMYVGVSCSLQLTPNGPRLHRVILPAMASEVTNPSLRSLLSSSRPAAGVDESSQRNGVLSASPSPASAAAEGQPSSGSLTPADSSAHDGMAASTASAKHQQAEPLLCNIFGPKVLYEYVFDLYGSFAHGEDKLQEMLFGSTLRLAFQITDHDDALDDGGGLVDWAAEALSNNDRVGTWKQVGCSDELQPCIHPPALLCTQVLPGLVAHS